MKQNYVEFRKCIVWLSTRRNRTCFSIWAHWWHADEICL